MKLLLFDVDLTLINSGGSGRRAMTLAFEELFGLRDGMHNINFAGRTDVAIFKDALSAHDLNWSEEGESRFKELYLERLRELLKKPNKEQHIEPGIPELLKTLVEQDDIEMALLTGNWRAGARTKLQHFGLFDFFPFGAFADDSEFREALPEIATRRFKEKSGIELTPDDVFVIGDTPRDVACARPFGAKTVAVATGFFSIEQLQAARPDFVFEDFSNTKEVLNIF